MSIHGKMADGVWGAIANNISTYGTSLSENELIEFMKQVHAPPAKGKPRVAITANGTYTFCDGVCIEVNGHSPTQDDMDWWRTHFSPRT